jgi:hypothetical protein
MVSTTALNLTLPSQQGDKKSKQIDEIWSGVNIEMKKSMQCPQTGPTGVLY